MFNSIGEGKILSVKCCCHDISEDYQHTLLQTRRRHLFIGTQTGLNYTKTRMGLGMMDKRMLTTLHELGVGESGLIYAVITGVVWLIVLSKVPRRRKTENFNMTVFALMYQKDAISGTTFKAN